MSNKFRATMALALTLLGVSSMASAAPPPEEKAAPKPTYDKRPGQEPPTPSKSGGGGPQNANSEGPSCPGGPVYRNVYDEETKSRGWRAFSLALYYRGTDGQIHAYQPGQDKGRDMAFPALARKLGLRLMTRAERRTLHREERKRYQAIVRKRAISQEIQEEINAHNEGVEA